MIVEKIVATSGPDWFHSLLLRLQNERLGERYASFRRSLRGFESSANSRKQHGSRGAPSNKGKRGGRHSRALWAEDRRIQGGELSSPPIRPLFFRPNSSHGNLAIFSRHRHTWTVLQAKTKLKSLEEAHEEHAENATNLSDDLQCLSEELDRMKKKLDGEASSVSDATPLAEIRAAIQRLRKENKELDVYLGVLVSNSFWIE